MKPVSDLFPINGGLLSVQKNHKQVKVADLEFDSSLQYFDLPEMSETFPKLRCGISV